MRRRTLLSLLLGITLGLVGHGAQSRADDYPSKPIRIVVPYPPGGSADLIGRMVGDKLSKSLGQPVVIENRGGASGAIGSELVAHAEPDGYTLLVTIADTHAINPAVAPKLAYHPQKDFVPISLLAIQPFVLAVGPSMPATTLAEFVNAAREKPGIRTYASNGIGGLQHLAMALFSPDAAIKMLHVPYRGAAPALADVLGGHVDAIFISLQGAGGMFRPGQLRALAITAPKRLETAPDVPTFAESGYASFAVSQWYGLMAPRGTPPGIVRKLSDLCRAAITASDVSEKLKSAGTEPVGSSPEDFAVFLDREIARWANVARTNDIKVE